MANRLNAARDRDRARIFMYVGTPWGVLAVISGDEGCGERVAALEWQVAVFLW